MKLESIFYAVKIADTGSFSKAARNLYMTQPNLSHAVSELEQELGVQLFHRTSTGVSLTPAGMDLVEQFRILLREYEQISDYVKAPEYEPGMSLTVGSISSGRGASAFSDFARKHEGEPLHLSYLNFRNEEELIQSLASSQLDLAVMGIVSTYLKITISKFENASLEYESLGTSPICAVVGEKNPLYSESSVCRADLAPYAVVQYGRTADNPRRSLLHELRMDFHTCGEICVSGSLPFYNIIQSTTAFGLIAASPSEFAGYSRMSGVKALPVRDADIHACYFLIRPKGRELSPLAGDFISELRKYYSRDGMQENEMLPDP